MNEIFRTSSQPSSPFNPFNFNRTNLALEERHSLLSGFLSSNSKKQVGDYIPHFTNYLQRLVPERQDGEVSMKVQQLFDPSNKHPLYQLFEFATYLSSNNMLTASQTDIFLKWVIDQNHMDTLKSFLQIKTPTVQAFSTRILESGVRIKDVKFLQLLLASGVKFDGVLEQAIQINELSFLTLLLRSVVDLSLLSGTSGGRLLRWIAKTRYTEIAQILIQNGADVNLEIEAGIDTTSLFTAVGYSDIGMVKCLLGAGARVGTWCRHYPHTALARAVFRRKRDFVVVLLEKYANVDSWTMELAALHARDMYPVLLKKIGKDNQRITVGDILYAAERGAQAFSDFLSHHEGRVSQEQLEKALKQSIEYDKFGATSALLTNGVDPNGPSLDENDRPLMFAACRPGITYSELLINAGASVNLPYLLKLAVKENNFDLLNLLIEAGADLGTYGPEALESAALCDRIEMAALLLDNGTAINAFGEALTGLQAARNIEFAQYLIGRGANVNAPASAVGGRTALQEAAERGDVEMVAFLLDEHADVNAPPAQAEGLTALEAAIWGLTSEREKGQIFKLLLENGALINGQDYRPNSILHDLIEENQEELIRLAVEAGADVNRMSSDMEARTPLQLAAGEGRLGVVKLLLEHGAEVNAPPGYIYGMTAFQAAVTCETLSMELIQFLIHNHADIHAAAGVKGGATALQGAAIYGHIKIALMLLQMGADVNARPAVKEGRTAIEGAAEHGRLDMVQLLLNAGAKGDVIRKTGFKKAIELAEKNRHFAIAQLLRAQEAKEGESSGN